MAHSLPSGRLPSPASPSHRHRASQTTTASGIADSTISYASTAATNESLHLDRFPSPPPSIPTTPVRADFAVPFSSASPTRSNFTITPPGSARGLLRPLDIPPSTPQLASRRSPVETQRSPLSAPPLDIPAAASDNAPNRSTVENQTSPVSASRSPTSTSSNSRHTLTGPRSPRKPPPPMPQLPQTLPLSPDKSRLQRSTTRPLPVPHNVRESSQTATDESTPSRPPPLPNPEAARYSPSLNPLNLSPYDWHEGSSSIGIDPTEDRLLSAAFITALLSSTDDSTSDENVRPMGRRSSGTRRSHPRPAVENQTDAMSAVSEMTYPPSAARFTRSASPDRPSIGPPPAGPPPPQPQRSQSARRKPPPSAFVPPPETRDQASSRASTSGDSETLISGAEGGRAPFVHTASRLGMAPATLRKVSLTSSTQDSLRKDTPEGRYASGNYDGQDYYRESGDSKLGLPRLDGPTSMLYSPALPSTAASTNNFPHHRQSAHSTKSAKSLVPSFISRITNLTSGTRSARSVRQTAMSWLRKPLPPVPRLPHIPIASEREHRSREANLPLPDLVGRAGTLSQMLEKGVHPHRSLTATPFDSGRYYEIEGKSGNEEVENTGTALHATDAAQYAPHRRLPAPGGVKFETEPPVSPKVHPKKRNPKAYAIAIIVSVIAGVVMIGIVVGVTESKKHHSTVSCSGNLTGDACTLDATCVCTSGSGSSCGNQLAQSLVSLTPTMNMLFNTNLTTLAVSQAVWQAQGNPSGGNCASQAQLIDVAPTLNATTQSNRTAWAQSAILWNLIQSLDTKTADGMKSFVRNADWAIAGATDGPTPDQYNSFSMNASGLWFNFAEQTVTQPQVTFVSSGQPSSSEISEVGSNAQAALDRMYTYASAYSGQRKPALQKYWASVLQQQPADLPKFMSILSSGPVLLPFDATSSPGTHPLSALLTNSTTAPFPPPLACYPGLSSAQMQRVNAIEGTVFALPAASAQSQFNTSCYADRPVYGVLDLLQLRLPFSDGATGVAKQAAILQRDALPRVVIYSGTILSRMPDSTDSSNLTVAQTDPRQYGTLNNFYHVVLNYLSSISDVNLAINLVEFVLSSPAVPPSSSPLYATLLQSIDSIPALEVAIFGSITPSDISAVQSSFSTPSGSLFFGSDQGVALRNWAITGAGSSVVWAQNATSAQVVRDSSLTDSSFVSVWEPASEYLHSSQTANVGVANVTNALQSLGKFSP